MNKEKIKFLLQAGHPRMEDRQDVVYAEAEREAASDPQLRQWVDRQQALTDAVRDKLEEIPVPEDLRGRILAGGSLSVKTRQMNRRQWVAMAAGLALILGAILWQVLRIHPESNADFTGMRHDMTEFLSGIFTLELSSRQLDKLQAFLAEEYQFVDYQVPDGLASHPGVGCRMIDWQGRQIALICFNVEGELVHLMVLPRDQLPDAPAAGDMVRGVVNEWSTASWIDERNVYLVSTRGSESFLGELLPRI